MSTTALDRSQDLSKLRDEGYEVEVRGTHLLVHHVPFVTSSKQVKFGTLVSTLDLAGDQTGTPKTHVVSFAGDFPCNTDGSPIDGIRHQSGQQTLGEGVVVDHSFSNKPPEGYPDYYAKMTRYITIISAPARALDRTATARTYATPITSDARSVFVYADTNAGRANITSLSRIYVGQKIAIVGVGGTGSYVLDQVAKTPVDQIHLFDGDHVLSHNAFRAPGAAPIGTLRQRPLKVDYFRTIYSEMHTGIVSHPYHVDASRIDELKGMTFVFVCIDEPSVKELIFAALQAWGIQFADVGMGIELVDGRLRGTLRMTSSTIRKRDHVRSRVSFADDDRKEYQTAIQIADLNMLNAALAIVKWKKILGFYHDLSKENNDCYFITTNALVGDDHET